MKKWMVILGIALGIIIIGFIFYEQWIFKNNLPVLAYHDVLENPIEDTDISVKNFEKQMKYLYEHNYQTLSLDEFYAWKQGEDKKGKKVVLTFDDGKESFYTKVVPILEKYNFKATVFVIQNAIDVENYLKKEQIEDLKQNKKNIDVQSHSYNLHGEDSAKSNDYNLYNEDMKINEKENYTYYAYPFGINNESYRRALKESHYKLAFLYSPSKWANRKQDNYDITRVPIYKNNSLLKFKLKVSLKI